MNGAHDLGGMHGFGPVDTEPDEPVFHHEWERRVFAMQLAAGYVAHWNIDQSRFAREQMPPAEYLATGYFEHWLFGLERLLDERGLVTRSELAARLSDSGSPTEPLDDVQPMAPGDVETILRRRGSSRSDADVAPRFQVGDRVIARTINPEGHTRMPRYVRGKPGVIEIDHGVWVYPDAAGNGLGPQPQHCYTVRFEARALWGDDARPGDGVLVDLWDDHLEPG